MTNALRRRLAKLEKAGTNAVQEIFVYGGSYVGVNCTRPESTERVILKGTSRGCEAVVVDREPDESFEDFRGRVQSAAIAEGKRFVVYGGLKRGYDEKAAWALIRPDE